MIGQNRQKSVDSEPGSFEGTLGVKAADPLLIERAYGAVDPGHLKHDGMGHPAHGEVAVQDGPMSSFETNTG